MKQLARCLEIGINHKEFCLKMSSNCTRISTTVNEIKEDTSMKSYMEWGFIFLSGSMAMLILNLTVFGIMCCCGVIRFNCGKNNKQKQSPKVVKRNQQVPLPLFLQNDNEVIGPSRLTSSFITRNENEIIQSVPNIPMKYASVKRL